MTETPTVEERFQAAINVIKSLPKDGPFKPTYAMMIKYYGYYKQATEGPCSEKKPAFWDVVGRVKWNAWNSNRHLTKHQAMKEYVDGLCELIETMSKTTDVADFAGKIDISSFDNIDLDELEMIMPGMREKALNNINLDKLEKIMPGMREKALSHPSLPFNSQTIGPRHEESTNAVEEDEIPSNSSVGPVLNDHFNGVTEQIFVNGDIESEPDAPIQQVTLSTTNSYTLSSSTVEQSDDEYGDPLVMNHDLTEAVLRNSELLKQIQATILRMNADLVAVNQRMTSLEQNVKDVHLTVQRNTVKAVASSLNRRNWPKWWPFNDISPTWFVLLLLWPFVLKRLPNLINLMQRRNK